MSLLYGKGQGRPGDGIRRRTRERARADDPYFKEVIDKKIAASDFLGGQVEYTFEENLGGNAPITIDHKLGRVPTGAMLIMRQGTFTLYMVEDDLDAWTRSTITFRFAEAVTAGEKMRFQIY